MSPLVAVEQSGMPAVLLTVAPVQKIKDSGIVIAGKAGSV